MTTLISNTPPTEEKMETGLTLGEVRAWSFSALSVFEECAYRTYIQKVKRIPEPSGEAAERGTMIHDLAEAYVKGEGPLPEKYFKHFISEIEELRDGFDKKTVEVEGEWGFTQEWKPCGWMVPETWIRIKLDAYHKQSETSARVIDYKSGKKTGNEIKHNQQGLLYAIGAFCRDPQLEFVNVEFWYVDQAPGDNLLKRSWTREQAMAFQAKYHVRGVKMTTTTEFDPSPSKWNCRWCHFKEGEYPECRYGIK